MAPSGPARVSSEQRGPVGEEGGGGGWGEGGRGGEEKGGRMEKERKRRKGGGGGGGEGGGGGGGGGGGALKPTTSIYSQALQPLSCTLPFPMQRGPATFCHVLVHGQFEVLPAADDTHRVPFVVVGLLASVEHLRALTCGGRVLDQGQGGTPQT